MLPWLLGATAVGYADKVRRLLTRQVRNLKWVAGLAAAPLVWLWMIQLQVFSLKVRVDPDVKVTSQDSGVVVESEGDHLYRVRFPGLDSYHRIAVKDTGMRRQSQSAKPFPLGMGRFRMLRGALAQFPVAGWLFGHAETRLSPLYNVLADSLSADSEVKVEGRFQEGFVDRVLLAAMKCRPVHASNCHLEAVQCSVSSSGGFQLPLGRYDVSVVGRDCRTVSLNVQQGDKPEKIDVDALCQK